jgi:hypothetical protein
MRSSSSRIVVDLPAPLGPRKPKISPRRTSRSTSTMPRAVPYDFVSRSVRTTGVPDPATPDADSGATRAVTRPTRRPERQSTSRIASSVSPQASNRCALRVDLIQGCQLIKNLAFLVGPGGRRHRQCREGNHSQRRALLLARAGCVPSRHGGGRSRRTSAAAASAVPGARLPSAARGDGQPSCRLAAAITIGRRTVRVKGDRARIGGAGSVRLDGGSLDPPTRRET